MNTEKDLENKMQVVAVCCGACRGWRAAYWGIVLVLLGGLGLLSAFVPLQDLGRIIFPALLVLWGGYILLGIRRAR